MKKFLLGALSVLILAILITQTGILQRFVNAGSKNTASVTRTVKSESLTYETINGIRYRVKAEGNSFYFYQEGKWVKQFIKGVNIGAGKPGIYPGELTISYDEYYRWFREIGEMNANCIRVYTTMRPQFYNALLDYNKTAASPLYLIQGVWMDEADINSLSDVYAENEKIKNEFTKDAKNIVDVVHGNCALPTRTGFASGSYTADVSPYLAGFLIGIEWDPKFVKNTNDNNPDRSAYSGNYLYTLNASPFEAFLCSVGDEVIGYQTSRYSEQVPVAFPNWITTDPLTHTNEPHPDEDMISVNMENIKSRDSYLPHMYLSYHIYPYYPDVLNYQKEYITYLDPYGKINPYRAYLKDLKAVHTMPVLVAEFGIPTSRGMAHESVMGYNQGKIDETAQGGMLVEMMNSMYEENYAGGMIFTWQDEWFKRTWNNVSFDVADKRAYWSNIQTNEQNFGIMAFDPGAGSTVCYIDGETGDWKDSTPVITGNAGSLYVKSDERYVYLMVKAADGFDFDSDTLYIPVDTIENQGNYFIKNTKITFDKPVDFVIVVRGKEDSHILVDSYYDSFYYLYGEQYKMLPRVADIRTKNSGQFQPMKMCVNYEMILPETGKTVPFNSYETGRLEYGISNPSSKDYHSLADLYCKDSVIELRIPWQLLNVMDPSGASIMDDLYTMQGIVATGTEGFSFGLGTNPEPGESVQIRADGAYQWKTWSLPTYHERLKPAYQILQKAFLNFK